MLQNTQSTPILPPEESPLHAIDPLNDGISSVALVRVSGSDLDVVNAARVSYGKVTTVMTDRDEKLIKFLMEHNHTSPFEHNQLSFRIKCPLYVARQWMRHRMNSYNEISYRYVQAKDEFYIPKKWRSPDEVNKQGSVGGFENDLIDRAYQESLSLALKNYEFLLASGVCREQARGLLPMCTYTEFIFTCNLHSLCHFLKLRLGQGAQHEIQNYAQALLKLALPYFPASLGAWKNKYMPHLRLDLDGLETVLGDDAK
jgi:thymidylate synthase (FAD)